MNNVAALFIFLFIPITNLLSNSRLLLDPSITRRCEILIDQRKELISYKMRIIDLIERNKNLQEKAPENKISTKQKLALNLAKLKNELSLMETKISREEENIIKKGCPGLTL